MKSVDATSQINFNLQDMSLHITITSSTEDQLFIKLSEFVNYDDDPQLLADDSFFIILNEIKAINSGEKFIGPLLDLFNRILVAVVLMPEEHYHITDKKLIDEIQKDFYWSDIYESGNLKTYVIFLSAENL
ncbi:hypothetical protein [Paenibacillus sp. Marseille-Q4541]|uniref:hypothetical protein n=1 Tax=Paenibacillus sp. Marseille-Q4541 TaxID=2831522 RepID=UPI001BA7E505|nr:hypothetical protein [Paenibacillus sp. Marseille-Q4541]